MINQSMIREGCGSREAKVLPLTFKAVNHHAFCCLITCSCMQANNLWQSCAKLCQSGHSSASTAKQNSNRTQTELSQQCKQANNLKQSCHSSAKKGPTWASVCLATCSCMQANNLGTVTAVPQRDPPGHLSCLGLAALSRILWAGGSGQTCGTWQQGQLHFCFLTVHSICDPLAAKL